MTQTANEKDEENTIVILDVIALSFSLKPLFVSSVPQR